MSFEPGNVWTPELTVEDAAGELAAATVALSVTSPSGVVTTPTPVAAALGLYTADVLLDEVGRWLADWGVSGAVTGRKTQYAYVRTLGANAVDLSELKSHLDIDAADRTNDDELEFFLDTATEWIRSQVSDITTAPARMATLELARHLWDSQRAGEFIDESGALSMGLRGFAIPRRVLELIEPFSTATTPLGSFPDAAPWPDGAECW